ncbi:squalene/phytoene synthase family protein [Haloferax mediterranei ATCC 33500]|uniref:Farnesyl-diphosphate farnesyltransferase n=1 Tax=Haloferax mediterranei (strain ATCC 33500 / DSM 1411 / JCM 8866 / NBRC 14739 / NCIMB 2177 / R-4) TaxID=523841 RepID=I3R3Q7_HALMT|nr:phytoene/squalene synthase family protein [Haloferax mediterranei]AFK18867.1 farnesyl-diphosphate farnesyltransferase (squalene synthase) [Haloferax mediterranei ATCC 33500]AHZ21770.1 farnesyl-diphosphate farnesyltransferase [Haloferax mediterranei ATCC 33500]EMA03275.1 farnesyl-diphosphate farnesyltransferase (squalene synthase) [Haloferax mediterranei ATCC 33500]MDX5988960.1 phytoene/squalene synthase family protein [Haloferax mediterranei ATCC 33500]QCQ75353.1 squalene/phytoene synthase 
MSRHADARPPATDDDLDWCHDAVQGVSRTFALTVDVLDEPMASHICIGYLLCRIADTVEDSSSIASDEQARLLRLYDCALDPDDDTNVEEFVTAVQPHLPPEDEQSDDWMVVANTTRVFRTFEALPTDVREAVTPPVRELVSGMAMFVERYSKTGGLRIQSREELEEYCYYAAGTVGNLITNLVTRGNVDSERRSLLYDTAEEFGLLLQLVNIAKDVHDDYTSENNVYLPAEWLEDVGVPQEEVINPEHNDQTASVVQRTATHAKSFLDDAQTYLETVPLREGNTLAAWAIPFLLAVGTLRELVANPEHAVTGEGVKVSRQEVFAVVTAMNDAGSDSLAEMREVISRQPFHRAATNAD